MSSVVFSIGIRSCILMEAHGGQRAPVIQDHISSDRKPDRVLCFCRVEFELLDQITWRTIRHTVAEVNGDFD